MSRREKKEWGLDTLLSVLGFVFELVRVVVNALRKRNGTIDHLRRLLKEPELVDQVFDLIVVQPEKLAEPATPTKSEWQILLAACRQAWVNPDFNEEHFPLEPVAPDEADWEVHEHHFSETVNGEEAFRRFEEMGYRFCGPRRAMEFIAAHPDIQMVHPLVVTARWQYPDGDWCAPFFYRNAGERFLYLRYLACGFRSGGGWLVLRKRG